VHERLLGVDLGGGGRRVGCERRDAGTGRPVDESDDLLALGGREVGAGQPRRGLRGHVGHEQTAEQRDAQRGPELADGRLEA